jgi:hypothetical protein
MQGEKAWGALNNDPPITSFMGLNTARMKMVEIR